MMKQWHILGAAVLPLLIGGCAASQDHGRTAAVYHTSTQQQAADLAREFRSQSYTLGEMADRRQFEADVLARDLGPDHPLVEKNRSLAQELRAAAEEADKNARDLRRTVPHGMVQ